MLDIRKRKRIRKVQEVCSCTLRYLQLATAANMSRTTLAQSSTEPQGKQTRANDARRRASFRPESVGLTRAGGAAVLPPAAGRGCPSNKAQTKHEQILSGAGHVAACDRAARRARARLPFRCRGRPRHWRAARQRVGLRRDCECVLRSPRRRTKRPHPTSHISTWHCSVRATAAHL